MIENRLINYESFHHFDKSSFRTRQPYPWASLGGFLTPGGFRKLLRDFPAIEQFEKHENRPRKDQQRPHNRYYLSYERSRNSRHGDGKQGTIRHCNLARSWQMFLGELEGHKYQSFIRELFGTSRVMVRYAWHIGVTASDVSPHRDSVVKVGTHIFYFNTSDDWSEDWGGATVILDGKRTTAMNPDFQDFDRSVRVPLLDNRSFIFKNTPDAWHGAEMLICPEGRYRRLFNVIFEYPPERTVYQSERGWLSRLKRRILPAS